MLPFSRAPLQGSFEIIDKGLCRAKMLHDKSELARIIKCAFLFKRAISLSLITVVSYMAAQSSFPTTGDRSLRVHTLDRDDVYSKIRQLQRQLF